MAGNAVIGQSGGPTAVINQSLVGVSEALSAAQKQGQIGKILGARHGVRGIINHEFAPLDNLAADLLERVAQTPSSALGSTRDKPDEAYCQKIFDSFKKNNVEYFFYIGGNDSADTARITAEMARAAGVNLRVYHVPKTIDNDLRTTDHCPGYGSAGRFVALAHQGDDADNRSLKGIKINIIMGRDAGWLTAASVLGRYDESDGPHLVYLPLQERLVMQPGTAVAMHYVGLVAWGIGGTCCGAVAGALACRVAPRPWPTHVYQLFGAWAITAIVLAGSYFTWSLWPR